MAKKISEAKAWPEAQQHTVACVLLGLCANLFESYGCPDVPYRLKRLRECAETASEQTRKKKHISRGAQRAWEKYADTLAAHTSGVAAERAFDLWGALVWIAYCFSFDCRFYCPVYSQGRFKFEWNRIHDLLERLAFEQFEEYPGCDERGCGIYEECSEALEGRDFRAEWIYEKNPVAL